MRLLPLVALALSLPVCLSVNAVEMEEGQQNDPIAELLGLPIVGETLPLAEVQRFCESRVPRIPEVATASEWDTKAEQLRKAALKRVVYRGEAEQWRRKPTRVEWLGEISGGPGYRIRKLRYEAVPGLWIPALLYEPLKLEGKVPVIMNVNGHDGTGKAAEYKQIRCINQAKRGMLALNVEWLGMGQLRCDGLLHYRMNQLDLCGTSGLAPFYLSMKRGLDILIELPHADPKRVAVTGLSGGGWQTSYISGLDTRVTLSNAVAGYSSFRTRAYHTSDLGDSEQTPNDMATVLDYTHLTAMRAPRPTMLTYNSKDNCCFASGHALQPLLDAAKPIFKLYDRENALRWHVNDDPGTHNYLLDNRQAFYRALGDYFYPGDPSFDAEEIPSDDEVKQFDQLVVELPEDNATFHSLATALSRDLPRKPALPGDAEAAVQWQQKRRRQLAHTVHWVDYAVTAIKANREKRGNVQATFWKLQMNGDWTVPVVELVRGQPERTAILVSESGRAEMADHVRKLLDEGYRVLAVDPFYFGESKISQRDFLYALLVAAVGHRPLGIQASQLAAVARWSAESHHEGPRLLKAVGPRSSLFALVAAALETEAIDRVELQGSLGSLKQVIESNWSVNGKPEMFCFGLLELTDIRQMAALVAPRPIHFEQPGQRVKDELADLADWYELLAAPLDPLNP